jgi:hypothetical protein
MVQRQIACVEKHVDVKRLVACNPSLAYRIVHNVRKSRVTIL